MLKPVYKGDRVITRTGIRLFEFVGDPATLQMISCFVILAKYLKGAEFLFAYLNQSRTNGPYYGVRNGSKATGVKLDGKSIWKIHMDFFFENPFFLNLF